MITKTHSNVPDTEEARNAGVFNDKRSGMSTAELIGKYKFSHTRLYFVYNRELSKRVLADLAEGTSHEVVMERYEINAQELDNIINPKPVAKRKKKAKK